MSDYTYYTTPQMDDIYAMVKKMMEQLMAEDRTWELDKYEVWERAIRDNAKWLIDYYWRGTNPLGFAPTVVKASKTKIRELQKILDDLEAQHK